MTGESLPIRDGIELYLEDRRESLADRTLDTHGYRLEQFARWCDRRDVDSLDELGGRHLHQYKVYRRDEDELALPTVKGDLDTLSVALEVWDDLGFVEDGLADKVRIPTIAKGEGVDDESLDPDRADTILQALDRFDYASRIHVMARLTWRIGVRLGGLRAIDVGDLDLEHNAIEIRHRPDTDTPLKNQIGGERDVGIKDRTVSILEDYLESRRIDTTDDHGRQPLISTRHGRMSCGAIRDNFYRLTRPCERSECPHDNDPEQCDATESQLASKCPSSRAPHAWRTGSISWQLRRGMPPKIVSKRVNAAEDTIDEHYDVRSHREALESRREHLEVLD